MTSTLGYDIQIRIIWLWNLDMFQSIDDDHWTVVWYFGENGPIEDSTLMK
jgi:hypothetical protein